MLLTSRPVRGRPRCALQNQAHSYSNVSVHGLLPEHRPSGRFTSWAQQASVQRQKLWIFLACLKYIAGWTLWIKTHLGKQATPHDLAAWTMIAVKTALLFLRFTARPFGCPVPFLASPQARLCWPRTAPAPGSGAQHQHSTQKGSGTALSIWKTM